MSTEYEIIESAPDYADAVASLADWAQNEVRPTTYALFLDLIGYSYDEYGKPLADYSVIGRLGYVEREKLVAAMTQYLSDPYRVTDWVTSLMQADDE